MGLGACSSHRPSGLGEDIKCVDPALVLKAES